MTEEGVGMTEEGPREWWGRGRGNGGREGAAWTIGVARALVVARGVSPPT